MVIMGGFDQAIPEKAPVEGFAQSPANDSLLSTPSGRNVLNRFALVVAAVRAHMVRLLHLMAMRAFRQRRFFQKIIRPPRARSSFRMPSFWVRHSNTPRPDQFGRIVMGFWP
jgi:hypothetical protein